MMKTVNISYTTFLKRGPVCPPETIQHAFIIHQGNAARETVKIAPIKTMRALHRNVSLSA